MPWPNFAFEAGQCATEQWLRAMVAMSSASRWTQ